MRKRSKGGRGARALGARNGRGGNARVNGSTRANAVGGARGKRGGRANGPNSGNVSDGGKESEAQGNGSPYSNGLIVPILTKKSIPEQYHRKNPVGSGSGVRGSNIPKALSSDYYLHKKFKKLTTALDEDEDGIGDLKKCDRVQDDSGSCSKKVDIAHSSCDQNSSRGGDSGSRNGEETSFLSTVKPQDAKEGGRPSRKDETQDLLNNKNDVDNGGSCSNVSVRDTKSLEIGQEQIRGDVGIPLSHSRSSSLNSSNPIDLTRGVVEGSPDNKSCNQKRDISLTEAENGATSNCASSNGVALNEGSNKTCGPTLVASETDDSSSSLPSKTAGGMPYKPKFRIATESSAPAADLSPKKSGSAEGNGRSVENSSSARKEGKGPALSKGTAAPERLNGDHRLDRKSLDDHISKLIDENQSILSTWPEHLKKRLKSQVQRVNDQQPSVNTAANFSSSPARPQSCANPSSMVILSGGSTTENPVIEFPVTGNGLHRQYRQMCVPHGSVLPAQQIPFSIRSHADVSTFSPEPVMLKKGALTPLHIKERTHFGAPVNSYPTGGAVNISMNLSPPAPIVGANGELNLTVVPKKRRRLSPTPSRLCGGEVSELPVNEPVALVSGKNGLYQDVDMTVRVSNCGTSGAKVTIRTSPNHSLNHVNPHVPLNYNHLMDVHPSPVKSSRMSSAVYPSNLLALHNAESVVLPPQALNRAKLVNPYDSSFNKDAQYKSSLPEVPADLRLSKPRGRPPKKERSQEAQDAPESSRNLLMSSPSKYPPEIRTNSVGSSGASAGLVDPKRDVTTPEPRTTKLPLSTSTVSPLRPGRPLTPIKIETNVKIEPEEQEERLGGPENSGDANKSEKKEDVPSGSVFVESSPPNPKRPNFLAIKPTNFVSKKFQNGVLPSPDTPRVAKPYNQMHINGNAYTYLGFKVSTRSSYTCLFKPQPMFIPQETDPKLSMYSNWQPRPRNKSQDEIGIMTNDSRVNGRKSPRNMLYTSAGVKCETEIVNSPDKHSPLWSFGDLSPSTPTKPGPSKLIVPLASPTVSMKANGSQVLPSAASSNVGSASNSLLKSAFANSGNATSETSTHRVSPPSQSVGLVGGRSEDDVGAGTKVTGSETSPPGPSSSILLANRYLSDISSDDGESSNPATVPSTENRNRTFSENRGPFKVDENAAKMEVGQDSQASSTIPESNGDKRGAGSPNLSNTNSSDDVDDERSSSGAANRYDHIPRVRIMEGGFESNEDYTYVRGRGRGRYVCEACGIRCKKPSMLRKHLKTHTDLRPYTCKLCNFSFKTKGNLTKHQKSKSHHKKCIGLGIHPESSQSLEMTGPTFSDTNTTDESEDDDGNETDSQEDIDVDDVSSSAETAQEIVAKPKEGSQTFEKEIAQSLLDLSKISRVQSDSAGDSQSTCSIPSESPVPAPPPQPRPVPPAEIANDSFYARNHKKFGPRNFNVEDTNSCSSFISAPDAPIDLSRPVSKPSFSEVSEHVSKKPKLELNGNVRSFGVVGEAQRWQPYNEFSITGCLNLKKVRNDNNIAVEDPSMRKPIPAVPPSSALSRETGAISIKDEKPPVHVFDFSNHIPRGMNGTPPMLSNSSTAHLGGTSPHLRDVRPINTVDTQPKDAPMNLPGPSRSTTASAPQTPPPKPQKLHQPWLSPPNTKRPTEVSVSEVSPRGGATITPGKGMSSGEAVDRKIFETPADLLQRDGHTGALHGRPGSHLTSPNNKVLAQAAGLKPQAEFRQPNGPQAFVKDEGKAECGVCGKEFGKASQLNLHMHIHYMERPFKCEPCGISFRTKGHLIKHRRSSSHESKVKVFMNDSWGGGVANDDNPRPFKCGDCKIAFRIHGHLAKHLRSKMHILRMECLGKLPFGIYFEMEKSGLNLTEIDTSDCDLSLVSLQGVARKIYGESWRDRLQIPVEESV